MERYKKYGQGIHTTAVGHVRRGEWKDNKIWNGSGTVVYCSGDIYTPTWTDGKMNGPCIIKFATGEAFEGIFRDNKVWEGSGTYKIRRYSSVGEKGKEVVMTVDVYTGSWIEGKQFGEGTLVKSNGEVIKGCWDGDKLVELQEKVVVVVV